MNCKRKSKLLNISLATYQTFDILFIYLFCTTKNNKICQLYVPIILFRHVSAMFRDAITEICL